MSNPSNRSSSNSGFMLISTLAALSVTGILVTAFCNFVASSQRAVTRINEKGEREDLRQFIRLSMNCSMTKAAAVTCQEGMPIAIKRLSGDDLIVRTDPDTLYVTVIGKFRVKANCTSVPDIYSIQVQNSTSNHWEGLFDVPIGC